MIGFLIIFLNFLNLLRWIQKRIILYSIQLTAFFVFIRRLARAQASLSRYFTSSYLISPISISLFFKCAQLDLYISTLLINFYNYLMWLNDLCYCKTVFSSVFFYKFFYFFNCYIFSLFIIIHFL